MVTIRFLTPEDAGGRGRLDKVFDDLRHASHLNHPNIATIYEIARGEADFVATEFVERRIDAGGEVGHRVEQRPVEIDDRAECRERRVHSPFSLPPSPFTSCSAARKREITPR